MSLIKNLRNSCEKVYHDSIQKVEAHSSVLREKWMGRVGTASEIAERLLKYGYQEVFSTLRVTTYHPMGWSWQYFKKQVEARLKSQKAEALNLQLSCPILLIHGISHNSTAFYKFEKTARKQGFQNLRTLEMLTTLKSIEQMGDELIKEVIREYTKLRETSPAGKIRLMAHSLGGMIVRAALLQQDLSPYVDRIIFLGVPHQGNFFYNFPVLKSLQDLHSNSVLMKKIKETPLPGNIEYWNFRGKLDVVTPARDTYLPTVPNLSFENVGHAGLLADKRVIETALSIFQEDSQT